MGLDQHRAQVTADWLDTETGEVSRARVAPADRAGVRRVLERFGGCELEGALGATTGWGVVGGGRRRAGGSWRRACGEWGRRCIWLSRPSPPHDAGTRSAPRTIAPTRAIC